MTGKFFEKIIMSLPTPLTEHQSLTIKTILEDAYANLPPEGSDVAEFEEWIDRWFGDI